MRVCRWLSIASLVLGVAVHGQALRPSPSDPQSGLIVGQVVDADTGRPIRDAVVSIPSVAVDALSLRRGGEPPAFLRTQILTGADGRFLFRDLPRGSFGITATKPGYMEGAYGRRRPAGPSQQLTLADAERVGDVVIRMWKHAAVTGTVVDEAGEPLVGIQVNAFRRIVSAGLRSFGPGGTARTDDRGVYRISGMSPGEYIVGVTSTNVSVPVEMRDRIVGGNNGTVRMLSPPGTPNAIQLGDVAYSLSSGAPIPPPPSGSQLFAYPSTFYSSALAATQAYPIVLGSGEERAAVDFQLSPVRTARISGVVLGPDGELPAFPLRLFAADALDAGLHAELFTVPSDGYGRFTFPAVPEGRYILRGGTSGGVPRKPGDAADRVLWANVPITITGDDIDRLVVTLQRGLRIGGRFEFEGAAVRPAGGMLESVPISIESADPGSGFVMPNPVARPTLAGQFTTVGIPPGRYFVRVRGSPVGWMFKTATYGGRDIADMPLDLHTVDATDVVITFTDRWTGVRGTVTMASGRANADALVLLFPTDTQYWTNYGANPRRIKSARTGRDGSYVINSVPIGSYYIVALPDEQANDWQDPRFLQALASVATTMTISDGEKRVQHLQLRELR